ncbi:MULTISPECIES: NAD(P)-binding oxidoreductase [unclassified Streptomyces]|uniref:NAD(P)-dependent oxidoreductase n=1 Tax=unclassified Streptomyces TaxID=2593676 RepID=UPI0033A78468
MKITVFGATSATGRVFVEAAERAGHRTTAFVRDPARLHGVQPREVIRGDVFDTVAVRQSLDGADAALIALGLRGDRRTPLYSRGTRTITDAMQAAGARRLLLLSEAAYSPHTSGIPSRLLSALYGAFSAPVIRERRRQDAVLAASDLDWTVIRPGILTDGPATHPLAPVLFPHRSLLARTSRRDLVGLLLAALDDPATYRHSLYP